MTSKLIAKIKRAARQDQKKRKDLRYHKVMGFMVAKGFLSTNQTINPQPNARIAIEDAIWAGKEVEPRILEVLPAAVLRLPDHFIGDLSLFTDLAAVLKAMRALSAEGPDFYGISYKKCLQWLDLPLRDKRTKVFQQKRKIKTFRLRPETLSLLKELAQSTQRTETDLVENLILNLRR
jgi:hypothetical protein